MSKGLTFVPTTKFNVFTWIKDLNLFIRKLKWHKFYKTIDQTQAQELGIDPEDLPTVRELMGLLDESNGTGIGYTELKKKSVRMPPQMDCPEIDMFLKLASVALEKMDSDSRMTKGNFTKEEMNALLVLEKDDNIILKPSDKGGNLVIMSHKIYRDMCYALLNDRECYGILRGDPTEEFLTELEKLVIPALDRKLI